MIYQSSNQTHIKQVVCLFMVSMATNLFKFVLPKSTFPDCAAIPDFPKLLTHDSHRQSFQNTIKLALIVSEVLSNSDRIAQNIVPE